MKQFYVRMGDGCLVQMARDEIRADLEAGTEEAADLGKIAALSEDEILYLLEIITTKSKFVSVERGNEIILTTDGVEVNIDDEPSAGIPVCRATAVEIWERLVCADTAELGNSDYSFKAIKTIVNSEQQFMERILHNTVLPVFYGAMPNLGLYTQPDGPVPNPAELLPQGKINEARACQEEAAEHATRDMVYVASLLYESGADGINFDTTGAAGDADFLATLRAVEILKSKYPEMPIMVGMAGEILLGMHGELYYKGTRLAGLPPHRQAQVVREAGATIFGPAINCRTNCSFSWNLARAVTYVKACVEAVPMPIHANVGMGVGGVPMNEIPSPDAISRVSKAMAEIARLDGL